MTSEFVRALALRAILASLALGLCISVGNAAWLLIDAPGGSVLEDAIAAKHEVPVAPARETVIAAGSIGEAEVHAQDPAGAEGRAARSLSAGLDADILQPQPSRLDGGNAALTLPRPTVVTLSRELPSPSKALAHVELRLSASISDAAPPRATNARPTPPMTEDAPTSVHAAAPYPLEWRATRVLRPRSRPAVFAEAQSVQDVPSQAATQRPISPRARPNSLKVSAPLLVARAPEPLDRVSYRTDRHDYSQLGYSVVGIFDVGETPWILLRARSGEIIKVSKSLPYRGIGLVKVAGSAATLSVNGRAVVVEIADAF